MEAELAALTSEYWEAKLAASPLFASYVGDRRYDEALDDLSAEGEAAHREVLVDLRSRAAGLDTSGLPVAEQVTCELLVAALDDEISAIDHDFTGMRWDQMTGVHADLLSRVDLFACPDPTAAHALVERMGRTGSYFDTAIDRFRAAVASGRTPAHINIERSLAQLDSYLSSPIDDDPFIGVAGPDGWDGEGEWRSALKEVVGDVLRPALQRLRGVLSDELAPIARDDDHPGLCHVAGGDETYAALVAMHTSTDLPVEEIHRIGMEEITEHLPAEYLSIAGGALGLDRLDDIMARLRDDTTLRFGSAEEIMTTATAAVERANDAMGDWFGRLPVAECRIEPVPTHLAPSAPPAYYMPPAGDGSRPGTYYVNTHAPRDKSRVECEGIAFHEAVPGHHLQLAIASELDVPDFQRFGLGNAAFVEGWALYTERLADEMGLYGSDLDRIGMLTADSWRAGRLVVDTGIHAMGWTRQQAIDFLAEHTPIDVAEISIEVDRYIGMPGQALSYKVGQREIFRLRSEAEEVLGDRFDLPGFHDAVLAQGSVTLRVLAGLVERWVASV